MKRQDGRVIELSLKNPNDRWLITDATFTLQYAQPAVPAASASRPVARAKKSRSRSELDGLLEQGYRYIPEPNTAVLSVQVMPDRMIATHIELKTADPIAGLALSETRGREPTVIERLRSKLQ